MAKKRARKKPSKSSLNPLYAASLSGSVLDRLDITITKTLDGSSNYVQITSGAAGVPLNIVVIADEIVVVDHRKEA